MTYDASMTHNSGERDDELVPIRTTWREELRQWWLACSWLIVLVGLAWLGLGAFWAGVQIGEWMRP